MKAEDCVPGRRVYVAGRYLLTQLNCVAEILTVGGGGKPTAEELERVPDHPYPHGMVQVRLPDAVQWPCREPWIGPEDLAPYPAPWMREPAVTP